jgi:tetratricopeptide (TPR) repeat protein
VPTVLERIAALEQQIRDWLCSPKFSPQLRAQPATWNQIVSSLDTLGDTEQAIRSFHFSDVPDDQGLDYLLQYGALQAAILQQDAVRHLAQAIKIDVTTSLKDSRLQTIRDRRNEAVGHPTRRDRSGPTTHHQISRPTLDRFAFEMTTAFEDGRLARSLVDTRRLLGEQLTAIAEILASLLKALETKDREAREQFGSEKLTDLFHPSLDYMVEKLWEATHEDRGMGRIALDQITKTIDSLDEALQRRGSGIKAYPGLKDWHRAIQHPIEELRQFFAGSGSLHPDTAAIVAEHVGREMNELREMAAEVDEDWQVE